MATYAKVLLSGSTSGKPVKVAATATAGTTVHTAVSGSSSFDEVWLWAHNQHTADLELTLELGGVTNPDNVMTITIPAKAGPVLVIPGTVFNGGVVIGAFAASANLVMLTGYVNRITP